MNHIILSALPWFYFNGLLSRFSLYFWVMANEIFFLFSFGKDTFRLIPFLAAMSKAAFKNYDYLLAWGAISTLIQKKKSEPEPELRHTWACLSLYGVEGANNLLMWPTKSQNMVGQMRFFFPIFFWQTPSDWYLFRQPWAKPRSKTMITSKEYFK